MKNKTPFQCGQEDAFFNLAKRPRYVLEGKVYKLVQSQEELRRELKEPLFCLLKTLVR